MDKQLVVLLLLIASAQAQMLKGATLVSGTTAASATPGFVNETSKNSILTNIIGTNPSGQTACTNWSYCIPYADPILSGNLGIIAGHFANSTTLTPTSADDQSNTYTCVTGASKDSGTNEWPYVCYSANMTAGAHKNTTTFGTTAVTQVTEKAAQFYNIKTTSPVDGTACGFTGASSNSGTGCAVTTTQSNSLVYALFCRAGTPATDKFQAGSGFTLITEDINDGCASEYKIQSVAGSVTPAMTLGTGSGSTYIGMVIAFKSATAGTAPSGLYLEKMASWSTPNNSAGSTLNFQFTSAGNFLFNSTSCGSMTAVKPSSDTVNTWTSAGAIVGAGNVDLNEAYVSSATANTTGLMSVVTTASAGDCTVTFYSFVGAPTTQIVNRASHAGNNSVGAATLLVQNDLGPDGASTQADWLPDPSTGLVMVVGGQGFNTTTGINAPASPTCVGDHGSYGGMNLSGPGGTTNPIIDENNPWGHCYTSSGAQPMFKLNESSSSTSLSQWTVDTVAMYGASSTIGIKNWTEGESSSTPLTLTVPSTTSGNLGAIACTWYNATARTMSKICFDGTTCAGGNAFAAVPSSTAAGNASRSATAIWHLDSLPASKTTLTVTTSGTVTHLECEYFEVQKDSGSWSIDNGGNGAATAGGTGSGTTINGPAITTTGTADFCVAVNGLNGGPTTQAPKSGNEYTYGGVIFNGDTNSAIALITTSASAHTPSWIETTSGDTFNASHACEK